MERTGRTVVILTVAAWLAALSPALATPGPTGDDPVRIGIGVGGELIDIVSPDEHDDEGDEDNGDNGGDNGDENGDEDGDGVVDALVHLVDRVLAVLFGEDDDSVTPTPVVSVAAERPAAERARPADDDGFEALLEFLEDVLDSDVVEIVEDLVDVVTDTVEIVVCTVSRLVLTPFGGVPCV